VSLQTAVTSVLLCLLPISELRGGLPYALARGMAPWQAYLLCVAANGLVGPLVFLFLSTVHGFFIQISWYNRIFEKLVARSRRRVHEKVEKYGYAGLIVFVAIPLPITGAYTGALGAWVLGMEAKKSFASVFAGVIIAGAVVTAVYQLGVQALYIFIK
jgi:uncharacterized membrane protein